MLLRYQYTGRPTALAMAPANDRKNVSKAPVCDAPKIDARERSDRRARPRQRRVRQLRDDFSAASEEVFQQEIPATLLETEITVAQGRHGVPIGFTQSAEFCSDTR